MYTNQTNVDKQNMKEIIHYREIYIRIEQLQYRINNLI